MRSGNSGFTLLEIVAVLVILGTLALSVGTLVRNDSTRLYVARDQLLSQLLYARAQGMAHGGGVCLGLSAAAFTLSGAMPLPGDNTLPDGVTLSLPGKICFDMNGSVCASDAMTPWKETEVQYCKTISAAPLSLTVARDNDSLTVTLSPATGFAH